MEKRAPTTKDIALIQQLFLQGQITLAPEFQRNSVWPRSAKAYLIDTILNDRPIPLLYFRRAVSVQTGKPKYEIIDGQQRTRAILEFLDDRFPLSESADKRLKGKKYSDLSDAFKDKLLSYDMFIEELVGYSDEDIRDMFVRMNRFVVKLSPQELRHAKAKGKFADFAEQSGKSSFWLTNRVFTRRQIARMRPVEFVAELAILLIEGPQDKKSAVDLYYTQYREEFPHRAFVERAMNTYLRWIRAEVPNFPTTRFRKPVDLYGLIGALDRMSEAGIGLSKLSARGAGIALQQFEQETKAKSLTDRAARYVVASSRQTDNVNPRNTRIEVLVDVMRG